ncbi:MAG: aldehyde dehydrogenase family protein [Zhongshania sp.]|uniref:aldehyde dehydrogenase family protein n=1 Tax=Zhongshania sp. TaxID=1971902 RepID=UPI002609E3F2|nr:aldehyde dehydrogenase family protein [Zhongshania sp.]MDF1693161.1 aldehyde dehydrogenase family protein [Zhongshania sp.]
MSITSSENVFDLYIDGKAYRPEAATYIDVISPATGKVVARVQNASSVDLDVAVAAARRAFKAGEWRNMKPADRSKVLYRIAQQIASNAPELAALEVAASGGTIKRILGLDIPAVVDLFMTLAEEVKTYQFVEYISPRPFPEQMHSQIIKEPIGVCGLITAWNFPILLACMKLAPALACGNTVVIKPASNTPTSTIRLIELIGEVVPAGVVNVINGPGAELGDAMTLHKDIDKISFTGSTEIGKRVQRNAAETLKRVTLELGGKGAAIVMPDADIERAAYGALFGVYFNSGQACESATRLIVHESIYEPLLQRLKEISETVVVGDPMDPATAMGPMSSESHFRKVMSFIESASRDGARIVSGGDQMSVPNCEGGFFVRPTIIADVDNGMNVAQQEIFGPVLSVIKFSTTEEAMQIANDTIYGLSAGIWTSNVVEAQALARRLNSGSVWINDWHMMRTDVPFGGYKQSGYGREFSKYSFESYLETKAITTSFETNVANKALYKIVHSL